MYKLFCNIKVLTAEYGINTELNHTKPAFEKTFLGLGEV